MRERILREFDLVENRFGAIERGPNLDWFVVKSMGLITGWNKANSSILVVMPAGYPTIPPDNFYADSDLRLGSGSLPGNTSPDQQVVGRMMLLFSFHIEAGEWRPGPTAEDGHNLLTFMEGIRDRLRETS